jgi:hypothetical protein
MPCITQGSDGAVHIPGFHQHVIGAECGGGEDADAFLGKGGEDRSKNSRNAEVEALPDAEAAPIGVDLSLERCLIGRTDKGCFFDRVNQE